MPGGRLTYEDRQQIAAGLQRGRGYAEIARTLGRPTSTVTREISRNGGPRGYRAAPAQRATERRAERRPARPSVEELPAAAYGRDPLAVREFVDGITGVMVETGLPRMMARVLSCFCTADDGSLTAAELVRRLRVSPASVSTAINYLESQAWVRRERVPGRRHDRYVMDDDMWYGAFILSAQRNVVLAETARQGAEVLGRATPAGARLAGMAMFLSRASRDMLAAADRWRGVLRS